MTKESYDLCIIGAGPGGLAALSAVLEPYSHDHLSDAQATRAAFALRGKKAAPAAPRVCVIDPMPWLATWMARFAALEIKWLRSPAVAHPDLFDALSLQGYACSHGRDAELFDSGAGDSKEIRALQEVSGGAWKLPSNSLFQDFCKELVDRLPHEFYQARVKEVQGSDGNFVVDLDNCMKVEASAVVLALGVPGPPIMPAALAGLPEHLAFHSDWNGGKGLSGLRPDERVLVLGGGLTAVQTAQLAHRRGCRVVLLSRRPLTTRHFDVDVKWFDRRRTQRYLFDFVSLPTEERLRMIKETRGGGSVPKMYMEDMTARVAHGRLEVVCGEAKVLGHDGSTVQVQIAGDLRSFDKVVSACGHRPDCTSLAPVAGLQRQWPATVHGGLPVLSQDLQWGGLKKLFVIGALAALQVGPDAGNLMGLRRSVQIVASALDLRGWLRDASSVLCNVRGNRFAALDDNSDDNSEEDDEVQEDRTRGPCGSSADEMPSPKSWSTACSYSMLEEGDWKLQ